MIEPSDFLDVANRLHDAANEAERRTAIGRAYYGLYNLLFNFLSDAGVPFPAGADRHGAVVHYLAHSGHAAADTIGQALNTLRSQRNRADYQLKATVDRRHSALAFGLARTQFTSFFGLQPATRAAIIEAIRGVEPYRPSR